MRAKNDIKIEIPEKAAYIIRTLEAAGFEAYVVGGCVRDSILGRVPMDWDITTSALPEQVKSLFRRTIDTGLEHGTVTIMQGDEGFEVTTYRIDGKYEDGRHPKEVEFTRSLEEDLKRRDFTINAMAYNESRGLVDLYEGIEDIDGKIIRCVGNPEERFGEDALRMLRAVRFAAQLGYTIEPETKAAIKELAPTLSKISAERIRTELMKLLVSDNPGEIREVYELGLTAVFLPEFDVAMQTPQNHPHHCYNVGEHMVVSCENSCNRDNVRLAMILHDIGKPATLTIDEKGITHFHGHEQVGADMAKTILRRLKFDNNTIDTVETLVRYHDYGNGIEPTEKLVRRAINKLGEALFPDFLEVRKCDVLAQSNYLREEKLSNVAAWGKIFAEVVEKKQCCSLKNLAVDGRMLMGLGIKPGPQLGKILNQLLEEVLEEPERNNSDYLCKRAKEINEA